MGDYSSFYLYRKYEITPDALIPTDEYSINAGGTMSPVVKNECDPECGCSIEPIYRWTESGYTCVGYDKYQNNIKEQSTDGGETWTVVIPEEYSASTLIESQSADCGYAPIDGKFKLTLSDSSTVSAGCDSTSAITQAEISAYTASLASAEIGNCCNTIGASAFYYCTSLTSMGIPSGVTSIGAGAFASCGSLTSITVDSNNTVYDSRNNCNAIIETSTNTLIQGCNSTVIPDSVTSIGEQAFVDYSGFTSVTIGNNVTSIGNYAFDGCRSLSGVAIPSGVTSIGGYAFRNCIKLQSITVNATTPPTLGSKAFTNTNNCPIYVPSASVNTYKAARNWSTYAGRIQAIS